jgi:hypothetical protein
MATEQKPKSAADPFFRVKHNRRSLNSLRHNKPVRTRSH